jgi:cytochrome c oxidase subunit 1
LAAIKFGHTLHMKQKPYNLLLWTGLILVLTSFFILKQNNSVDIHLHDTYFVIAHTHVFWLLAMLALFVWTLYLLTNRILYSKALTWTHVIVTILTLLLFALTLFFGDSFMNPTPRRYYDYSIWNSFDNYTTFTKAIGITIFVLLLGQFIFVINLIAGLFKRLTKRKT